MDLNSHIMAVGAEHGGLKGVSILINSPSIQMLRAAIVNDPTLRQEAEEMLRSLGDIPSQRCVVSAKTAEILRVGLGG